MSPLVGGIFYSDSLRSAVKFYKRFLKLVFTPNFRYNINIKRRKKRIVLQAFQNHFLSCLIQRPPPFEWES